MKKEIHILLAEDDANLGMLLKEYLEAKDFYVQHAKDGEEGLRLFNNAPFDICILDVMMPLKDGFSLAKDIRKRDKKIPIIFLTAKTMKENVLEGFESGADDYMTKPFSMEELLMRISAILRRVNEEMKNHDNRTSFKIGNFDFDYNRQILNIGGDKHKLTSKENELLRLLCISENTVLDRSTALKEIWEDDNYFNARSMDVYIAKLRKLLKVDPNLEILNVHGKGFKLLTK